MCRCFMWASSAARWPPSSRRPSPLTCLICSSACQVCSRPLVLPLFPALLPSRVPSAAAVFLGTELKEKYYSVRAAPRPAAVKILLITSAASSIGGSSAREYIQRGRLLTAGSGTSSAASHQRGPPFAQGCCKQMLWPLMHYLLPLSPTSSGRFDRGLWQACAVAARFFYCFFSFF